MNCLKLRNIKSMLSCLQNFRLVSYVQGQSPAPGIREYFYYVDHQGMLFMDDTKIKNFTSCFKDKEFLVFFFKRLKVNENRNPPRYEKEFPYISYCGVELNYVRCDDKPIVFTHITTVTINKEDEDRICHNHAGDFLYVKFEPTKLCMLPKSGRVYHPAPLNAGGVGLVKSSLAMELSRSFIFENGEHLPPTHFKWKNKIYKLTNEKLSELLDDTRIHEAS